MKSTIIESPLAPAPVGAYSQAKRIGPYLQISGQLATDPETGQLLAVDIAAQTTRCLEQLEAILQEAGGTWDRVLTMRVYMSDDENFDAFDAVYSSYLQKPYPARITVGAQLAPGALVEIEAFAILETP